MSGRRKRVPELTEELKVRYPSLAWLATDHPAKSAKHLSSSWEVTFNQRPDAMHALLADFIKQVHAQPGRVGQRPMPDVEQVDFSSLMYGEENVEPIPVVLPKIMKMSERSLASRLNMSRTQVQRMIRGEYIPDVNELRSLAVVVKRTPVFFVEYRQAMALAACVELIVENPGIATKLYREYLTVKRG